MNLGDVVNEQWLDAKALSHLYRSAEPFPHIEIQNFIKPEILKDVANEFPNLQKQRTLVTRFNNDREIKLASRGMQILTPSAIHLNSYLQSDLMLNWLNDLTGIKETLISDPYLSGGGYHEIKSGGYLKIHADFNKHPKLDLDRRLNMLIYLNEGWNEEWGGALQLFDKKMEEARRSIFPLFNTAVIFTTTSYTYHGHPEPLNCPENRSRRSLAYYYFSTGRPKIENITSNHGTLFKPRKGEKFSFFNSAKPILYSITPPIIINVAKKIFSK